VIFQISRNTQRTIALSNPSRPPRRGLFGAVRRRGAEDFPDRFGAGFLRGAVLFDLCRFSATSGRFGLRLSLMEWPARTSGFSTS
jgi:hypothetical protein